MSDKACTQTSFLFLPNDKGDALAPNFTLEKRHENNCLHIMFYINSIDYQCAFQGQLSLRKKI